MNKPHFDANDQGKKYQTPSKQGKQKSTAIALSLASCLFMSAVGYGVIRENSLIAETSSTLSTTQERGALIAKKNNSFALTYVDSFFDDEDNYQIKQLKEHNARQSAKIRALRQELIEKMQDLYMVKAHLFKQEGDPRDKEKLAELSHDLGAKNQQLLVLNGEVDRLKNEAIALHEKIRLLESSRNEFLNVSAKDDEKEQEILALRQQLEALQSTPSEQTEWEKKARILEMTQCHLAESLEQKSVGIAALDLELIAHKEMLLKKDDLLKEIQARYAELESQKNQSSLEFLAALEQENTSKLFVESQLSKVVEEKAALAYALHQELENQKHLYEITYAKFLQQKDASETQLIALSAMLDNEMEQTKGLQEELQKAYEQYALTLFTTAPQLELAKGDLAVAEKKYDEEKQRTQQLEVFLAEVTTTAEGLRGALENATLLFEEKKDAFASLEEEFKKQNTVNKEELAAFALTLDEAQLLTVEFQEKLYQEISLRREEREKNEKLAAIILENENQINTLEEAVTTLKIDAATLKDSAYITQQALSQKKLALNELQESMLTLQQRLEEEAVQKDFIAKVLQEKQEHAFAIEETIAVLTLEKERLEQAVLEGQLVVVEKSSVLSELQERVLVVEHDFSMEKEQRELLSMRLTEKERDVVVLEEALSNVQMTKNQLEHALVVAEEALKTQDFALSEAHQDSHALALMLGEERIQKGLMVDSLVGREARVEKLEETILTLTLDIETHEIALREAHAELNSKALNLKNFESQLILLTKQLDEEKSQRNSIELALAEKQAHTVALEKVIASLGLDVDAYENALIESREDLTAQSLVLNESQEKFSSLSQKFVEEKLQRMKLEEALVETREILENRSETLKETQDLFIAFEQKFEEEIMQKELLAAAFAEKELDMIALDEKYQNLKRDIENLEITLKSSKETNENHILAFNDVQVESHTLKQQLREQEEKHTQRLSQVMNGKESELVEIQAAFLLEKEMFIEELQALKTLLMAETNMRSEFEAQLAILIDDLEKEKAINVKSVEKLLVFQDNFEQEQQKVIQLKKEFEESVEALAELEDERTRTYRLIDELEISRNANNALKEQFTTLLTQYENEVQRTAALEGAIRELSLTMRDGTEAGVEPDLVSGSMSMNNDKL